MLSKLKKGRFFHATEQPFFLYRREAHLLKTGFLRQVMGAENTKEKFRTCFMKMVGCGISWRSSNFTLEHIIQIH
jgi:hypothetical protein